MSGEARPPSGQTAHASLFVDGVPREDDRAMHLECPVSSIIVPHVHEIIEHWGLPVRVVTRRSNVCHGWSDTLE